MRVLAVFQLLSAVALCAAPVAVAEPATPEPPPVVDGLYNSPGDPGWVFFLAPQSYGGFGCGIGPDGTVGCDTVPDPVPIGSGSPQPAVPPGANQTVAGPQAAAQYRHSDTPTFTRDVDVLPEGHQLANGNAFCAVGYQGSVSCTTGDHGFVHYGWFGTLEPAT